MALDPKWSEEARKSVKETNIDDRMLERMANQKAYMETAKKAQEPQTPAEPDAPSYPEAVQQEQKETGTAKAGQDSRDDIVSEACERIMAAIARIIKEEFAKIVKEGKLAR